MDKFLTRKRNASACVNGKDPEQTSSEIATPSVPTLDALLSVLVFLTNEKILSEEALLWGIESIPKASLDRCLKGLGYPSKYFLCDNRRELQGGILDTIAKKTGIEVK